MFRAITASSRARRLFSLGLITIVGTAVVTVDTAQARRRHHHGGHRHHVRASSYSPPFSSIVVDANSGAILQANNTDALRHPASLTKIMTLYLLFERLQSGKIKLDSDLKVSEHASEQAPTKLGLKPGQTIEVEDAIKGLVTRSANDAAVTIAEGLGGSEDAFATMMTRKARALGMSKTVYRNASGLPDDEQVTTARDQSILGRAIQERFPQYYRYFSTSEFRYRGTVIRNHNHLLGRVEGVDGIKTGYTNASGFNLVTSIRRGNRHLVAVVMGGRSASSRDSTMRNLLAQYIDHASATRTVAAITERAPDGIDIKTIGARTADKAFVERVAASEASPQPVDVASAQDDTTATSTPLPNNTAVQQRTPDPQPAVAPVQPPAPMTNGVVSAEPLALLPGSSEPLQPKRVKTLVVRAPAIKVASAGPPPIAAPQDVSRSERAIAPAQSDSAKAPAVQAAAKGDPSDPAQPPGFGTGKGILGVLPARPPASAMAYADPMPRSASAATTGAITPAQTAVQSPSVSSTSKPQLKAGTWIVQVGALESEAEASKRLNEARNAATSLLGKAMPFTEAVERGEKHLYRARFANLDRGQAEAACKALKKSDISCFAIKN